MLFLIDEGTEQELEVIFPYDKIYPEQYSYVCDLKRSLDGGVSSSPSHHSQARECTLTWQLMCRGTACWRCLRGLARLSPSSV